MDLSRGWAPRFCAMGIVLLVPALVAQGSKAGYQRALALAARTENRVARDAIKPQWLSDGQRFWYRVSTGRGTHEYVLVDVTAGTRAPLFDHAKLAAALGEATGKELAPDQLALADLALAGATLRFRHAGRAWRCELASYEIAEDPDAARRAARPSRDIRPTRRNGDETTITFVNRTASEVEIFWIDTQGERHSYGKVQAGQPREQHTYAGHVWLVVDGRGATLAVFEAEEGGTQAQIDTAARGRESRQGRRPRREGTPSPDGRFVALVRENNVWLREASSGLEQALSRDGSSEDAYRQELHWSPDSCKLVAVRVRRADARLVQLVEAAPRDQVQPKLHSRPYRKPGDPLPKPQAVLFTIADRRQCTVDDALYTNPFTEDGRLDVRWAPDSSEFYFSYNQRGHQVYRVLAVPAAARENDEKVIPRIVVEETSPTFIDWTNKTWRHWLDGSGELLWMSERDGWCHLWLYDVSTGRVRNQVTRGEWVVRRVEHVDVARRQVWFFASGLRAEEDPYHQHLCRIGFDGSDLVRVTEGDGNHRIEMSPDRRSFVDTWSRADQPPVIELRHSADGKLICELERADASALLATGWTMPERFVAKGRDGQTHIHGILIRPSTFDPTKRYPVVEEIYAGPHGAFVPKEFGRLVRQHAIAELGFVVVQIDGMGTNHRGKAFHDVCWRNLGDAGFPDRIAWLKAAAATRPWMDLSRVGIYGGSAGGQSATRALLAHGDFYKVAVSDCGCHDNRMDKIWWNEQWMGWPIGPHYEEQSNVTGARNLTGKLLLIVGELDNNVDPASTMQVAAALVRANKDFDLLVMPSAGHGAAETPYGSRRRMDFLVRHLHGREPRW